MPEQIRAKHYDVFVSYKREDDAARDVLIAALQKEGFDPWWDAKLGQGDFRHQLRDEINRCDVVIALWSQNAHARPDEVKMEMAHAFGVEKLLPLKLDNAPIPAQFAKENFLPFDGWADEKRAAQQLAHILAEARKLGAKPKGARPIPPSIPVEFGDIPGAPDKLIGRDTELEMLHGAWESRAPKKVNAVVLHALGGAGKSALLRTFANELLAEGGGGASRIYGWSAYSQGSGEQKRADADGFISKALGDFGWQGELPRDPVERARALAKLIQKERVLLLLDGLEPLQDAPNVNKGRFKDKGLAELVKMLANQNAGLMVLTTRQEVPELEGHGSLVVNHPLEDLSDHAGADLLVDLGVHGRQRDLEAAVREVQGHALSVTLLGTYLAEVCGGDIRHRDQFDFAHIVLSPEEQSELLTDKTIVPAKRAAKVMRGYLAQFDKLAKEGDGRARRPGTGAAEPARPVRPAGGRAGRGCAPRAAHSRAHGRSVLRAPARRHSGWLFKSHKIELEPLPKPSAPRGCARRRAACANCGSCPRPIPRTRTNSMPTPWCAPSSPAGSKRPRRRPPRPRMTSSTAIMRLRRRTCPIRWTQMQPLFHAVQHGVKAGRAQEAYDEVFQRRIPAAAMILYCPRAWRIRPIS